VREYAAGPFPLLGGSTRMTNKRSPDAAPSHDEVGEALGLPEREIQTVKQALAAVRAPVDLSLVGA
jgi:hypothetical protein